MPWVGTGRQLRGREQLNLTRHPCCSVCGCLAGRGQPVAVPSPKLACELQRPGATGREHRRRPPARARGWPPLSPACFPRQSKRTNLKKPDSERTGRGLRVRFNPLALLLDASLEGEFDLVQRVIYEVSRAQLQPRAAVPRAALTHALCPRWRTPASPTTRASPRCTTPSAPATTTSSSSCWTSGST